MGKEIQKSNNKIETGKSTTQKIQIGSKLIQIASKSLETLELPRLFNQLVIFLLDGSGSMTFKGSSGVSKGNEVHSCVQSVINRLLESKNKSSFDIAAYAFANGAYEMVSLRCIKDLNGEINTFNPCSYVDDNSKTRLVDGLTTAKELSFDYLEKYKSANSKVLIIILGDGAIGDYKKCFSLKESLINEPNITVSTIYFESPKWKEKYDEDDIMEMKNSFLNLATSEAFHVSTFNPEDIRKHMIQSITKISQI